MYSSPQICLQEVSMCNKSVWSSTTNFPSEKKFTSTELEEQEDSEEKESQSTLFCPKTQSSSEKSRTTTTPKLKRCLKISRTLTQQEETSEQPSSFSAINEVLYPECEDLTNLW